MEDTGYSFKSTKIHLIVKALTLYPMINVIERIYKSMSIPELILITFLMFVYYFVYDLITNKKIKFKVTIIGFIATCVILWIVIWGMETFCKFAHKDIKIEMNDIKQVGVNLFDEFDIDETEKLVVTNQETLNLIFDNMFPITRKSDYKSYYNDDTIKSLILSLKLKNNKKVNITVYLEEDKYKEVISRLKEDEAYINSIINYYTIENDGYFEIYNSYINLNSNKKLKEAVNKNIKEYVKNTMQLVIDDKAKYYTERFEIYEYKNHKLYRSVMQIYESTQMEKDILRILNEISKNKILKIAENSEDNEIIYTISRKINQYEEESRKEIREYQNDKIFNFIKEDYANEFDSSKPYYKIQARRVNHYKENVFYTNNVEKFEKCIENQMNLEEDFYFLDTSLYDGKYYEYNETSEVMENDL